MADLRQRIPTLRAARRAFETVYVLAMLERHFGNVTRAAATAGMDRPAFHRKCRELGISPTTVRAKMRNRRKTDGR